MALMLLTQQCKIIILLCIFLSVQQVVVVGFGVPLIHHQRSSSSYDGGSRRHPPPPPRIRKSQQRVSSSWTPSSSSSFSTTSTLLRFLTSSPPLHITPTTTMMKMTTRMMEKDGEESLITLFQRAVILQRSGGIDNNIQALDEYQRFIKVAEQCDVNPKQYAEVYCNMGVCEMKLKHYEMSKHYFELAIQRGRPIGIAYVNLALLTLQEGRRKQEKQQSRNMNPQQVTATEAAAIAAAKEGWDTLQIAQEYCEKAISLNDDKQSTIMATKLLEDIHTMLKQRVN